MSIRWAGSIAIVCLAAFFAGCHSGSTADSSDSASAAPATQPSAKPIPPDSIFAKVKMGEERDEVFAAIGQPTSMSSYMTGKSFIPFHYSGSDETRLAAHYKGVGIITFGNDSAYTSGYSVVDIQYDPSEPGY
jgi:hypothetical protein